MQKGTQLEVLTIGVVRGSIFGTGFIPYSGRFLLALVFSCLRLQKKRAFAMSTT